MSGGLTLNSFEVEFKESELSLHRAAYSKESFDHYKDNLAPYFFYRYSADEGDWIYAWKRKQTDDELPEDFQPTQVKLEEHAPIFAKIVEESIVQLFKQRDYDVFKVRYSSMWEVTLQKEEPRNFGALSSLPMLVFSLHNLYSKRNNKQVVALSVRGRQKPRFVETEREINEQQIDTRDWTRNSKGEITTSKANRKKYLEATGQSLQYEKYYENEISEKSRFKRLLEDLQDFQTVKDKLFLPEGLEINNFSLANIPNSNFIDTDLWRPRYYYHNERTQKGYYDKALAELGPYSKDLFNRKIEMLALAPNEYEGNTDEYVLKLKKKLHHIFHLKNVNVSLVTFDNPPEGYVDALQDIDVAQYDIALVVVSEEDKRLAIDVSPYHRTKAKLLNQRVPSQDILVEKIRKSNIPIENNLALNIYSKLGGTAWTIEKAEKNTPELIIGIGSTTDANSNRIIGFANVFDHNGTYLVGDCSQLTTRENYADNLRSYLVKIIRQAIDKKGISTNQQIRLLFHLYKGAAEKYELRAIRSALSKFQDHQIQYGIVHLSYNHNFRLYKNKGKERPERGTFIQISTLQGLLHLGGSTETPVLIRLDKRADYKDLHASAKQVLWFAHLSHRSFRPASVPVTIKYPSLMAKMVSELGEVPSWDPDILNKLSDKLWFI